MAEIQFKEITKRYPDGFEAVKAHRPRYRRRRVHDPRRPVGLREVDGAAHDRRARGHHRGRPHHRRRARQRPRSARPRHRDGLPELRAVPAHDRAREHGLRAQARARSTRREIDKKVGEAAKILDLEQHLERKPANLSGGQRQRVAMGRAIVRDPKAFLMDEPLSNLDAKLRVQMRTEVARIQKRLGTTMVYVTHDQTEAMTLGDRVAVMRAGHHPAGRHAGQPLREPGQPVRRRLHRLAVDELPARAARGRQACSSPFGDAPLPDHLRRRSRRGGRQGARDVIVGVRPEHFEDAAVEPEAAGPHAVQDEDRRRRVDGLRALRLLRHRGARRSSPTELERLAKDAGMEDLPSPAAASRSSPACRRRAARPPPADRDRA